MKKYTNEEFKDLTAKEKSLVLQGINRTQIGSIGSQKKKIDKNSIAYKNKIEYQKRRSKYLRHLFPHNRIIQNEKCRKRAYNKKMNDFIQKQQTIEILKKRNMSIPDYLKNLKKPGEYQVKKLLIEKCKEDCEMCLEARAFLGMVKSRVKHEDCEGCILCNLHKKTEE
jgi:uncharacterized protein YllA (UPF0747 family)